MIMMEANWLINDFCNFDCIYCYPGSKKNKFIGLHDYQKIIDGFNRTGLRWLIYISGGEPFLFPNFVELCEKLTEKHIISLNTNLSHKDVFRFAECISPERVRCFHCSLHIQEREKHKSVKDFIYRYKFLESKRFYVYASYVLHPLLLNRFRDDYAYFKSEGIILRPKIFRGTFGRFMLRRTYPDAYSKKQKKMIISYIEQSQKDGDFNISHKEDTIKGRLSDVYLDKLFINGLPSFKGRSCLAGKNFVRLTPEGNAYRCYNENQCMGNLFDGTVKFLDNPQICESEFCVCPYIGYRHILKKDVKDNL